MDGLQRRITLRRAVATVGLCLSTVATAWPELAERADTPHSSFSQAASAITDAEAYYAESVDAGVQQQCLACHQQNGAAAQSGARLILSQLTQDNHAAFSSLLAEEGVDTALILEKVTGGEGHGGGAVVPAGSALFLSLQHYLELLEDGSPQSEEGPIDFWEGTAPESREITLRRATLLLSGKIARHSAIQRAKKNDSALREEILSIMQGEGFKGFLVTGANDRLLISGLENGIDFNISTFDRYPSLAELLMKLPDERPEEYEDYHERPFLTRGDAEWMFRRAVAREPLELIAHVVMNDRPYTEVLTADYTMVNAFSDLAYRSESGFDHEFTDDDGFYDRRPFGIFRPGYNDGHIPHDEEFEINEEQGRYRFSGYQQWPHAGVLSTQSWLARYPSTDTNRNRARARWTYFHFLDLDIEKSAPRSTDPAALADTDNPTLKNPACTVCHERLDPMAGAYQSFGDLGHYFDQYGGMDSLSDAYKCPECYGGERGSTEYQDGDTWYRDMRAPGFEGLDATPEAGDSLQWLATQIVLEDRFARATVKFWWPSVFGAEPLAAPNDRSSEAFEQQMNAFSQQDKLISKLATRFVRSGYDLKSLLADMLMSPWYRRSRVIDPGKLVGRSIELSTVGRGRLLTPEELDRKNQAVFGRTWRQWGDGTNPHTIGLETAFTGQWAPYKAFYGGIDGAIVTRRNRDMTPLMSNVAESMAIDLSCQVVVEDFDRPQDQRLVFRKISKDTVPGGIVNEIKELSGTVSDMDSLVDHVIEMPARLVAGPTKLTVHDLTRQAHDSTDGNWTGAELLVHSIALSQGGADVVRLYGRDFSEENGLVADRWQDEDGVYHWRGHADEGGWRLHPGAWVEVEVDLPPGEYQLRVELGSALMDNNVNDAMTARVAARATRNLGQTADGKLIRQQIASLLRRATSRVPSQRQVSALLSVLDKSAARAKAQTPWFRDQGNHCEVWWVWPNEHLEGDEYWERYGDAEGMMRGWSTALHSVMTSYGYLHD